MQAVISGQAGVALLMEQENCFLVYAQDPDRDIAVSLNAYPRIFRETHNLNFLEDIDRPTAVRHLIETWSDERALSLAHYLLDADFSEETRKITARELEALSDHLEHTRRILFTVPLPDDADIEGAIRACEQAGTASCLTLFTALRHAQGCDWQRLACLVRVVRRYV